MSDISKIWAWVFFITSGFFATLGVIRAEFPTYVQHFTLADEPKIEELTLQRFKQGNIDPPKDYQDWREIIIEEHFSKEEYLGFKTPLSKIFLIISGFFGLTSLIICITGFWPNSSINKYFLAKAEFQRLKSKKYAKTLDDLIALQEKISKNQ